MAEAWLFSTQSCSDSSLRGRRSAGQSIVSSSMRASRPPAVVSSRRLCPCAPPLAKLPLPRGVDTVGPRYGDAPVGTDRFQYLALMGACLVLTLPLEVVIGARVWRQVRRLLAALWFPVAAFTLWDEVAIARGHWTYNPRYISGLKLP